MQDLRFTAKLTRDTTPRGVKRSHYVRDAIRADRGCMVETQDEQLFFPGVDPIVSEALELTAYPDSAGSANIFIGDTDEIIASIGDCAAWDLDLHLFGDYRAIDFPESLITHLRTIRYNWCADDIKRTASHYDEDPSAELAALRAELGL